MDGLINHITKLILWQNTSHYVYSNRMQSESGENYAHIINNIIIKNFISRE